MTKTTLEGYVKISSLQDIIDTIAKHKTVDTIRFATLRPFSDQDDLVYVALWSRTEQHGYGGCVLRCEELQRLKNLLTKFRFENTGAPIPDGQLC